jgi:hypothetical protein
MQKFKTVFALIIFCMIGNSSKSQTWPMAAINAVIDTIPYIFEGQVQSVEIYAGDDHGNRLPLSSVVWNGDIGYFFDSNGKRAQG